jgi:hypothetical protein
MNSSKDCYFFKRAITRGYLHDLENSIADFEKTLELNPNKVKAREAILNFKRRLALRNQNLKI